MPFNDALQPTPPVAEKAPFGYHDSCWGKGSNRHAFARLGVAAQLEGWAYA